MFQGYWNDAEATRTALTPDGWLRTGDIAVVDDDGYLYLVDRAKDLIIVSGFNVYPAEVEEVLLEHPAIERCAVVGVPHPHSGEAVKAYVVVAGRALDRGGRGHRAAASDRLARYKCPEKVMFVDELPAGHGRQGAAARAALIADGAGRRRLDRTGGELGRSVVRSDGRSLGRRVRQQEADEHDGDARWPGRRENASLLVAEALEEGLAADEQRARRDEHVGHGQADPHPGAAAARPRSTAPRR